MSNETAKFLNSRRRHKTDVAIARQVKIAKSHGMEVKEPHSTIEPNNQYFYYTNCGTHIITTRNDVYKIGDTITYVYKKLK